MEAMHRGSRQAGGGRCDHQWRKGKGTWDARVAGNAGGGALPVHMHTPAHIMGACSRTLLLGQSLMVLSRYTMAGVVKSHMVARRTWKPRPMLSRMTGAMPIHAKKSVKPCMERWVLSMSQPPCKPDEGITAGVQTAKTYAQRSAALAASTELT